MISNSCFFIQAERREEKGEEEKGEEEENERRSRGAGICVPADWPARKRRLMAQWMGRDTVRLVRRRAPPGTRRLARNDGHPRREANIQRKSSPVWAAVQPCSPLSMPRAVRPPAPHWGPD